MKENIENLMCSILNVSPSDIANIDVFDAFGETTIYLKMAHKDFACPYCHSKNVVNNGSYERRIIIDNDFVNEEKIKLSIMRYKCNDCGHSFSDTANLAPRKRKISYKMIYRIMELLKSPSMTFKEVSKLTKVSETSVIRIFDNHTHIPRIRFPEAICIDEVYTKNSDYKSKYSCIFYDFDKRIILDVLPCRRKGYLHYYLTAIPKEERDNVKYVCIDMYEPYKDIVSIYFKKAIICVDSFHVVKHITDDLNKLRIRIMKTYDPNSQEYYLLNRFRFLLFDRSINLDNEPKFNKKIGQYLNYNQLLEMILSINADLRKAYELKEMYIKCNSEFNYDEALENMDTIINEFALANTFEFEEFVGLLKSWKIEIINSFIRYKDKRINNGVAESINETVSSLIYNTKGIRNNERRRKRIMYAVNKTGFILK